MATAHRKKARPEVDLQIKDVYNISMYLELAFDQKIVLVGGEGSQFDLHAKL